MSQPVALRALHPPVPMPTRATQPPAAIPAARPKTGRVPIGTILLKMGAVAPGDLLKAVAMQARQAVRLGDILLTHGWVTEDALLAALARQWGARVADLEAERPDPRLVDALGAEFCLREALLPWRRVGGATVIATARPEDFARVLPLLPAQHAPYVMALASRLGVHSALMATRQTALARRAETMVPAGESCRPQARRRGFPLAVGLAAALVGLTLLAPALVLATALGWTLLTLAAGSALKLAAFVAEFRATRAARRRPLEPGAIPAPAPAIARLPMVSLLVPLLRERDIAPRLIRRLGRLSYPRELLDILLIVEEDDHLTRTALTATPLPSWMRVVTVPTGPIKTKPRALNFAMNAARGSIIGIYDAEDAPEADQIHKVVRRFHERGPEVACLQGVLDYYNPRTNWLARCFTIEYATWFRVVLPGLARLGFVIPLGGTTLFFRREAIEKLGGWDAYNVTEDADLGLRLARHGYRAEFVETVTEEEANCHALPWIKQRSRWIKGYALTWAVHMRSPLRLWRELGAKRFWGVQILFLGSLTQVLMAPLLWSFWLVPLGLGHPFSPLLPHWVMIAMASLFLATEVVNIGVGLWAVRGPKHRHLLLWVPTLHFYFPLGSLAAWKGFSELLTRPFFWDKTQHGVHDGAPVAPKPVVANLDRGQDPSSP